MNDFSGLGILVEEKESTLLSEKFDRLNTETIEKDGHDNSESEVLLPPLPNEEDITITRTARSATTTSTATSDSSSYNNGNNTANLSNTTNTTFVAGIESRSQSVSGFNSPFSSLDQKATFDSNYFDDSRRDSEYSEILSNTYLSSYDLNSPTGGAVLSINSATPFQIFPSISTPAKGEKNDKEISTSQQSTSPLKRLKSLKNGIRKLSLSSINTSSKSAPTTNLSTPVPPSRPVLSPIQTSANYPQISHSHRSSQDNSSTNSDSIVSIDTTSNSNNMMNSSYDKMTSYPINLSKRSRALSGSALTPITPPYSSPVITLSENLQNSKKSLLNIEHSYFDALNVSKSTNSNADNNHYHGGVGSNSSNSYGRFDADEESSSNSPIHSVSELSKPSELIDYFMFLKEQKKSVIDAFEGTRKKLNESGWCSEHDLNNLQLQQDASLCQLDTKLLQIKERLDTEFNMSLFNENTIDSSRNNDDDQLTTRVDAKRNLSPSLKVLENRCFSFSEIN